jgi:hypothetical protein
MIYDLELSFSKIPMLEVSHGDMCEFIALLQRTFIPNRSTYAFNWKSVKDFSMSLKHTVKIKGVPHELFIGKNSHKLHEYSHAYEFSFGQHSGSIRCYVHNDELELQESLESMLGVLHEASPNNISWSKKVARIIKGDTSLAYELEPNIYDEYKKEQNSEEGEED